MTQSGHISFDQLIGQEVMIKFLEYKPDKVLAVRLVGHEPGGVWLESQDLMEDLFAGTPYKSSLGQMQYFVPFQRIVAIYHFGDTPWVSETIAQ